MMANEIIDMIARNGLWAMVVAVVFIGAWFKYREHELKVHQDLRMREMEHQREMKQLELELEKTKAQREKEKV